MANVKIVVVGEDQASDELKKVVSELNRVDNAAQGAGSGLSNSFMEMKAKFDLLRQGVETFTGVFKKAFEWGEQGAQVRQTSESFDYLLQKIGAAPDLLDQLRAASRGTVDDMTLMSNTMTLVAGAEDQLAQKLAQASPQLLELAKAANKLNPSLGDVNYQYQSLALGIKRASPMILDNLGLTIKLEEAYSTYAAGLGKTAEQLTAVEQKEALLSYVLNEAGDNLKQQAGTVDSATDSFARLEAAIKNMSDQAKSGLTPIIDDAATALLSIGNIIKGVGFNTSMLTAAWEVMQGLVNDLIMNFVGLYQAIKNGEININDLEGSMERLADRTYQSDEMMQNALNRWNEAVVTSEELAQAQEEAAAAAKVAADAMAEETAQAEKLSLAIDGTALAHKSLKQQAEEAASGLQVLDWAVGNQSKGQAMLEAQAKETTAALEAEKVLANEMDMVLSAALAGQLAGTARMNQELDITVDQLNAVGAEIERLITSGVDPNSEAVQALVTKYEALDAKMKSTSDSIRETTAAMIYQQASQGLGAEASLELARKMGMVSEEDYAVAKSIQDLRAAYDANRDGAIDAAEGVDKYSEAVKRLYDRVVQLQQQGVSFTASDLGSVGGMGGGGMISAAGAPFAQPTTSNAYNVQIDAGVLLSFTDEQSLYDKLGSVIRRVVRDMDAAEIP